MTDLRDTFDTIGVSEAAAVIVLAQFLGGDARDMLSEKFALVDVELNGESPETSDQGSWLHVVNALLRRFVTDEELRKAHDTIEREEQSDRQDEGKFAERISKTTWPCCHMLTRDELENFHVHGLKTAIREMVVQ